MDAAISSTTTSQGAPSRAADSPFARPKAAPMERAPTPAPETAAPPDGRLDMRRSVERDATTDSLVYRLIDLSSGIVTIQTPSDARLKLRAYIDGVMASGAGAAFEAKA